MSKSREISQIGTRVNVDDTTGDLTAEGRLITDATQDATSISTGSIQTDGGISSTKSIYVGPDGKITTDNTTESTSPTIGSIQTDGGLGVVKDTHIGGDLDVEGRITSSTIEALTVANYIDQDLIYPFIDGQDGTAKDFDDLTDHSTVPGVKVDSLGRIRFYTQITGRKPIKNPMIGMKLGMERHTTDSLQLIDDEFGPNGEKVYSVDGRDWIRLISGASAYISNGLAGNYYNLNKANYNIQNVEVVAYCDSINFMASPYTDQGVGSVKINGGTPFITGNNAAVLSPLYGRFLDGTSLIGPFTKPIGLSTYNISATAYSHFELYGFELGVTSSTDLTIFPQTVISNGERIEIPYSNSAGYKPDVSAANYGTSENNGEFDIGLDDWQKDYLFVNKTSSDYNSATGYDLDDVNTKLLLHLDGDLRDRSGQGHKVGNELGVKFENINDPFGTYTKSIYFNSKEYLRIPTSDDFSLGTVDWSMDAWVKSTNINLEVISDWDSNDHNGSSFELRIASGVGTFSTRWSSTTFSIIGTTSINDGNWHHIAARRSTTTITLYIDGVSEGTPLNVASNGLPAASHDVIIGQYWSSFPTTTGVTSKGNIREIRFIKGSAIDYTNTANWSSAAPYNSVLLPNDIVYDSTDSAVYKATFTDADYKTDGSDAGITWETINAAVDDSTLTGTDLIDDALTLTAQGYFENARSRYYNVTDISAGGTYDLATFETFTEQPFNGGRCVWFSHPDYNSGLALSAVNWIPKYAQSIAHVDNQHNDPTNARPEFAQKLETLVADIVEITGLTDHDTTAKHSTYSSETGIASASTESEAIHASWYAFNKEYATDGSDDWITSVGNPTGWLQYEYFVPQKITKYVIEAPYSSAVNRTPNTWTLEGSNNGNFLAEGGTLGVDYWTLDTVSGEDSWSGNEKREFTCDVTGTYKYYRLVVTVNNTDLNYLSIGEFKLLSDTSRTQQLYETTQKHYGYTSETGTVSEDNQISPSWKVFDYGETYWQTESTLNHYVQYEYVIPQKLTQIRITNYELGINDILAFTFKGSNDGITWSDDLLAEPVTAENRWISNGSSIIYPLNNATFYKYYKLYVTDAQSAYVLIKELKYLTDELVRDKVFYQNEEMVKKLHWREFGNGDKNQGSSDTGFDTMDISDTNDRAFTLDDGLTTLVGQSPYYNGTNTSTYQSEAGDFLILTWIGTGIMFIGDTSATFGTNIKIGSDLPYGSHTIKWTRTSNTRNDIWLDGVMISNDDFWFRIEGYQFYQPKKPDLPEGSVILADYMLMADYIPLSEIGVTTVAKGTRRIHNTRDVLTDQSESSGTDWIINNFDPEQVGAWNIISEGAHNAWFELPFYGDAITLRPVSNTNSIATFKISIDDSYDLSSYTVKAGQAVTINDLSVGLFNDAQWVYSSHYINISGLGLGPHKIKVLGTTASGTYFRSCAFDIHTPIHRSNHYSNISYNPYVSPEIVGGGDGISNNDLIVDSKGEVLSEVNRPDKINNNIAVKIASTAANQIIANLNLEVRRGLDRFNMYMKGWQAIGTSAQAIICLEPGEYNVSFSTIASTNNVTAQMWVNGVFVQGRELTAVTGSTDIQHSQYFEYGDIVNISGNGAAVVTVETYATNLTITKLKD